MDTIRKSRLPCLFRVVLPLSGLFLAASAQAWAFGVFSATGWPDNGQAIYEGDASRRPSMPGKDEKEIPDDLDGLREFMGDDYLCMKFDNFLVASDLDQNTIMQLATRDFMGVYYVLTRDFFYKAREYYNRNPDFILTIFLFKDQASFAKGLRHIGQEELAAANEIGSMTRIEGVYFGGEGMNRIAINYRDNYLRGLGTFSHELTHALLKREIDGAPIWLNEGLATLFGNSELIDNLLRPKNTPSITYLQAAIQRGQAIPLSTLLSVSQQEFYSGKRDLYYVEAQYFCKYLYDTNRLLAYYREFQKKWEDDPTGVETMKDITRTSIDDLEKDWHAWLKGQKPD